MAERPSGTPPEVFKAFLKLGLTSFGGPIAHLGYFRAEFVARRQWLDDRSYSDLVALCQFLPGPASSQVGIALGWRRAGALGSLAAWLGFMLPSALALIAFAYGMRQYPAIGATGWVHGLKIAAVAVVAQAVWGMARSLCPDRPRAAIAILAALLVGVLPSTTGQMAVIVLAGLGGRWLVAMSPPISDMHRLPRMSRRVGFAALSSLVLLLVGLPAWATASGSPTAALLAGFFRSGALVFGGGHVVLPLLQATVVPSGAVSNADFLAGYGAAQAVPGPLFTFAAYLGAVARWPLQGWLGGLVLLVVVFLPAFLLVYGALPFWDGLRHRASVQSIMAGINAGVVGILAAALYDPIWTNAIHSKADFGVALAAFGLLLYAKASPVLVVVLAAAAGWVLGN